MQREKLKLGRSKVLTFRLGRLESYSRYFSADKPCNRCGSKNCQHCGKINKNAVQIAHVQRKITLSSDELSKYEVTINPQYPTTRTQTIPSHWYRSRCKRCGNECLIDFDGEKIHHKTPFCHWFYEAWLSPTMIKQALEIYILEEMNNRLFCRIFSIGTETGE